MRALQRSVVALTTLLLSTASVTAAALPADSGATPGAGSLSVLVTTQTVDSRESAMNAVAGQYNLGEPLGPVVEGLKDNGAYRVYQRGVVVHSPATGAQVSHGGIRTAYAHREFEKGFLGYPTTGELSSATGVTYQNYQGGTIAWTSDGGAHSMGGLIETAWLNEVGRTGILGYPTSEEYGPLLPGGGGTAQNFQGGIAVTSDYGIGILTPGAIRTRYFAVGGYSSDLGFPMLTESKGLATGGASQAFQNGAIVWSPATGAQVSKGAIRHAWLNNGGEQGFLGYPVADEYRYLADGVVAQDFQGGKIIWSARGGTIVSPAHP